MTPSPSHRLTDGITPISLAGDRIKVPSTSLSEQDKATLEEEVSKFKSDDEDTKTTYVPLLLDDKVAHGHYDGYCKQSEFSAAASMTSVHHVILSPKHSGHCSITCSGRTYHQTRFPRPSRQMSIGLHTSKLMQHLRAELWTCIVPVTSFGCMITISFSCPNCCA